MLAPSPFGSRNDDDDAAAFLPLGSRESEAEDVVVVSGEGCSCSGVAEAVLSPGFEEDVEGTGGGIESPPEDSAPGVSEGEELSDLTAAAPVAAVVVMPTGLVSEPARDRIPAGLIDGDELVYAELAVPVPAPYTPRIDDGCDEGCIICCC